MDPMDREALVTPPPGSILTVERTFDAPRARVWTAWTVPDLVARWWGPKGATAPVVRISLRIGGVYFFCLRSPAGRDICSTGFYHEIVPEERLVATGHFADEKGRVVPASHYGFPEDFPAETLLTVAFEDAGTGRTKLLLRHAGLPPGKPMEDARQGWNESLDKLAAVLAAAPGL
jgi:uncharacterized protein YndB with AHSA1/START domain